MPVACFSAVGDFLGFRTHPIRDVDGSREKPELDNEEYEL